MPASSLAYLAHCLLPDKVLLCSPYTDVWQLRRGSRWGPGQHVRCASHHPSTVFPFTPEANGPKLQETSHCCFSQSVTQAPCKPKTFFSSLFLFFCGQIDGVLPVWGWIGWGLKLGGGELEGGLILGLAVFLGILPSHLSSVGVRMGGKTVSFVFNQNPVSVSSPQLWPEGKGSKIW